MSGARVRLSALVVNYQSGGYAVRCVQSLMHVWALAGRDPADLEVIVVDNASPTDETAALAKLESLGATIDRAEANLGYARGMNRAFAHSSGGSKDVVAILNPDLFFLEGSVEALLAELERESCGIADPKATIDPGRELYMPRNAMPTLTEHVLAALAQRWNPFARYYAARRLAIDLPWLESERPELSDMLSGCCLFMRRETIARLGGLPMDDIFPLYYEDTDLCRRVRALGLELVHCGNSNVVHHWSRSAGAGAIFEGEPRRRYRISQNIFFRRYYGALGAFVARWFNQRSERWARTADVALHRFEDLGESDDAPLFEWDEDVPFLIEASYMPNLMLAGGVLGSGRSFRFSQRSWEWMFPGRVFARVLDRRDLRVLRAFTFAKTSGSRTTPLRLDEVFDRFGDARTEELVR